MINSEVSSYVKKNCANHDRDGLCLLETDSTGGRLCPLVYDTGKKCKYAEQAVIPGDPAIEAIYNAGKAGATSDICERCGSPFERTNNRQKYCVRCSAIVRGEKEARRKRESRLADALKRID